MKSRASIAALRGEEGLDVKTVFSQVSAGVEMVTCAPPSTGRGHDAVVPFVMQARNGRAKRLSESLTKGFDVNSVDEFGNSLLIVAAQNVRLGSCCGSFRC